MEITSLYGNIPNSSTSQPEIDRKAQEFEAVMLSQLLKPMFDSVETSALFGEGPGSTAYKTMMTDAFAEAMAERGGLGIADQVKDALIKLQSDQK